MRRTALRRRHSCQDADSTRTAATAELKDFDSLTGGNASGACTARLASKPKRRWDTRASQLHCVPRASVVRRDTLVTLQNVMNDNVCSWNITSRRWQALGAQTPTAPRTYRAEHIDTGRAADLATPARTSRINEQAAVIATDLKVFAPYSLLLDLALHVGNAPRAARRRVVAPISTRTSSLFCLCAMLSDIATRGTLSDRHRSSSIPSEPVALLRSARCLITPAF